MSEVADVLTSSGRGGTPTTPAFGIDAAPIYHSRSTVVGPSEGVKYQLTRGGPSHPYTLAGA
jgi:hypothetical protein